MGRLIVKITASLKAAWPENGPQLGAIFDFPHVLAAAPYAERYPGKQPAPEEVIRCP
jgi:hypothetical protein